MWIFICSTCSATLLSLLALVVLLILIDYTSILIQRRRLPPGPIPVPIFGNTLLFPDEKPWVLMAQLSEDYDSAMITFWVGRQPTIYLNDCWTAHELLDKRAAIYASRPRQVVLGELLGGLSNIATMYYGVRWRLHRRLTHCAVGKQKIASYRPIQDMESRLTTMRVLENPGSYVAQIERSATSVMCIIGTGCRVEQLNDPLTIRVLETTNEAGHMVVPGKKFPMILETFPIAANLPCVRKMFRETREPNVYYTMSEQATHEQRDCYFKFIFESKDHYELSTAEVASLTGNLFGAGVETSTYTILSFLLACCCVPDAFSEARREIDEIVGCQRSPTYADAGEMPHVKAVVTEVLRWRAPAVLGGQPHAPVQDDSYKGYFIPKGISITGNLWAIHRHPRDFPEPDLFCPERHFPGHELYRSVPMKKRHMAFGWGRRICAGAELAEQGLLIQIARLLWAFDIRSETDPATGELERPDIFNYTSGFNIRPKPFRCRFTPRNEEIRQTIVREGVQAQLQLGSL